MNGHFASVGDEPAKAQYEHGCQVIDEDKLFKYVASFVVVVGGGIPEF